MRKIILIFAVSLVCSASNAQEKKGWCLSAEMYQQSLKDDPQFAKNQRDLETLTEKYSEQYLKTNSNPGYKMGSVVKIIPVVVHVIHEGGAENISDAQILSQIDVLNKDYRRLNADTVNTPGPFKPLGADTQIEFRMAQKDPNGNCTNGIVRVFSHLTTDARDNVKALSYWPSNQYLNIWIVKSIENTNGLPGIIGGFAQFPGGPAATDGIEVRSEYFGVIGTASPTDGGRVSTHEIGHWLNLRHIWGDDQPGTCTGTDYVTDTPNQADMTFSICPTFPLNDNCQPTGNGVLFSDYMDYTNGGCQNIFTAGQSARMNFALSSGVSGRNNLSSSTNLTATGTDGTPPVLCAPIADFNPEMRKICAGTSLSFADWSFNGDVTSYNWTFPGGVPATDTSASPVINYPTPGMYDVTLTVSNAAGSSTVTHTNVVAVDFAYGFNLIPWAEGFETISFPGNDWQIENEVGNPWAITNTAAFTGTNSLRLYNFVNNPTGIDAFITPSYSFQYLISPKLSFRVAFATRSSASGDLLKVYSTSDCGISWVPRYSKVGNTLATAGVVTTNFVPTGTQWRKDSIVGMISSLAGKQTVRFKFEYSQKTNGNNIYIDDINITSINTGINDFGSQIQMQLMPNPSSGHSILSFQLAKTSKVSLRLHDVTGRELMQRDLKILPAGNNEVSLDENLNSGIYFIELTIDGNSAVQKMIVE